MSTIDFGVPAATRIRSGHEVTAEFRHRHVGFGGFEDFLEAAEVAFLRFDLIGKVDQPHLGRRGRKVDAELLRHLDQAGLRRDRIEELAFLLARLRSRIGDLNADRPENAQVARRAPEGGELGVDRGAMLLHARQRAPGAELQVGIFGGEIHSGTRLSGLDDDRPLLR